MRIAALISGLLLVKWVSTRKCHNQECENHLEDAKIINEAYQEAIREVDHFDQKSNLFGSDDFQKMAENYSIAALTAIKLSQRTRDFDHSFNNDRLPRELCPLKKYRCSYGKYRHSDGRCTTFGKPLSGSSMSPFSRRVQANYDDDISDPRFHGSHGQLLPPPDVIEKSIFRKPLSISSYVPLSSIFVNFADFLHQDFAKVAKLQDSLSCCTTGLHRQRDQKDSECLPLGEHFSSIDCYIRSAASPLQKCSFGRREQMNLATSFLDAGPIYQNLKDISKGKIPSSSFASSSKDENPLVHLITEEHNWVVDQLLHNPSSAHLSSETLFEEAKKFVIAELQHITFHEYLPILLGEETMKNYDLVGNVDCKDGTCHKNEANTLNEFGVVAGQFHKFMKSSGEEHLVASENNILNFKPVLRPFFYNSDSKSDPIFDILMRGRDHGLGTYAQWREECGGGELEDYEQLIDSVDEEVIKSVHRMFKDVRDVDLVLLGLAENPVYGSLVGPTFGCIIAMQFRKAKHSDSYWYETHLSKPQLAEVQKSTISGIICRHGKLDAVPKDGFAIADEFTNIPIACNSTAFPTIDFSKWIEESGGIGNVDTKFDEVLGLCIEEVNSARKKRSSENFQDGLFNSAALHSYGRMMLAKDEAVVEANVSFILLQATKKLIHEQNMDLQNLQGINIGQDFGRKHHEECNPKPLPCDPTDPYRTYTGWCNNLANPSWANTFTELKRMLPPEYDDGVEVPRSRSSSNSKLPLPSPRLVSNIVHAAKKIESVKYSHFLMEFGQFIDHDITHSPVDQNPDGTPLNCSSCDSPQSVSPSCFPIRVPQGDPMFSGGSCLSFVRSLPAQKTLGYRNQMNQISAYLDGSVMYGSTKCEGDRLRTFEDGKLRVTRLGESSNSGRSHLGLTLPQSDESEQDGCLSSPQSPCFIAGDDRNSQQTLLIAVHSVFHREHERVTTILKNVNPNWDDERLYRETRKIISAQFAHVVYSQYLPIVIGQKMVDLHRLRPLKDGYFEGYDPSCDASILQPFAAAAFRFGHSTVTRFTPMRYSVHDPSRQAVDLASEFLNMSKIYQSDDSVELIVGGMHSRYQMATDRHVDDAVRNFLFSDRGRVGTGLDLIAINIQRGRDHGIQSYNSYRSLCGLERLNSFFSMFSDIEQADLNAIAKVYDSPDDIDLFTGIVSEKNIPGAIVGPTAACIISEQFSRLKKCDRYFYESGNEYVKFTEDQLQEIRKVSMSSIICANTKIRKIAKDVFSVPDQFLNSLINCKLFHQIDYTKWKDSDYCSYQSLEIKLHTTSRISPCTTCTCTKNGLKCHSQAPVCSDFEKDDLKKDPICMMQCAHYFRKYN